MQSKKISKAGGFTLPKQVRADIGLFAGNVVDIEVVEGGIFIKKHSKTCKLCGGIETIVTYKNFDICKSCIDGIQEVANV